MPGRRLQEKGVLIAGAPLGALEALAGMAGPGANVILCGSQPWSSTANGLVALTADLADEAAVEQLFERVLEHVSSLDVLVVVLPSQHTEPLAELALGTWQRVVLDQLRAAYLLCRRLVEEALAARRAARIVLVPMWPGAVQAGSAVHDSTLDDVLQTALVSLARSIAKEYGRRGIACNVVLPAGPAPLMAGAPAMTGTVCAAAASQGIVELISFLASDEASFINGEMVLVKPAGPTTDNDHRH